MIRANLDAALVGCVDSSSSTPPGGYQPPQPTLATRSLRRLIPPSMSKPGESATACINYLQPAAFE